MLHGQRVAVVVPALNEAPRIGRVLRSMPAFVDDVVVVDDGSRDGTATAARDVGDPRVRIASHDRTRGVGAALITGYRLCFAAGAEVAAVMAGDAQMHPDDLSALLLPVVQGDADYAKGNRLAHPEVRRRMPLLRLLGNRVLSLMTRWAIGVPIRDSQCGYTALSRTAHAALPWDEVWRGYGYPNDLLGWLRQRGARIAEVPVVPVYADEVSGIRWRHALVVVPFVLLRVMWRGRRPTRSESACASGY